MTNIIKFIFVISVFITKNIINIYKKTFIFSIKNMQIKNLAKAKYNNQVKLLKYNIK